jgi:hypothetical protein
VLQNYELLATSLFQCRQVQSFEMKGNCTNRRSTGSDSSARVLLVDVAQCLFSYSFATTSVIGRARM